MYTLHHGDCLEKMALIPDASVDAIISDPPYPEIDRPYGRMTEAAWAEMMHEVVRQSRRVLKPTGSAVFILQPNSRKVGSMRPWLWEFMAWCCREWNIVQDCYWWNITTAPTVHTHRAIGLMRPSVKPCVWIGDADCYRNQDAVLWSESDRNIAMRKASMALRYKPSVSSMRDQRCGNAALDRGGVTPMNILPIPNADSTHSAGAHGHGAGTPYKLADWWTRYISKPGDTILDMFNGVGTMGLAALNNGRNYIGIERDAEYFRIGSERIRAAADPLHAMYAEAS